MSTKLLSAILGLLIFAHSAMALEMPTNANQLAEMSGVGAQAYVVIDIKTGEVLIEKNANIVRVPASLTKIITALVVLDSKPKLNKVITMTNEDQVLGGCREGGACIKSKAGVKFTLENLLHAALISSSNNAASALFRSTGLTQEQFAKKMNEKAIQLGASSSSFVEPTGMSPENKITAIDFAKIAKVAFTDSYIQKTAGKNNFYLKSTNNSKYNQSIKNTNKLLKDPDITILAAKTGYLDESGYNFASLVKTFDGQELVIVVLGERSMANVFLETKKLTLLGQAAKFFTVNPNNGLVLGDSINN